MTKFLDAMKTMARNSDKITNVIRNNNDEIFFLYKQKYCWSMLKTKKDGELYIYYYPNVSDPSQLISITDWEGIAFKTFSAKDFEDNDASAVFEELYTKIDRKIYDMDSVLDDILKDEF